jgi:hypothetical protein
MATTRAPEVGISIIPYADSLDRSRRSCGPRTRTVWRSSAIDEDRRAQAAVVRATFNLVRWPAPPAARRAPGPRPAHQIGTG